MNNILIPLFTSNKLDVPFNNSSLSEISVEDKPISFQNKFMSKMDNAMKMMDFEEENISDHLIRYNNVTNNHHQVTFQSFQPNNNNNNRINFYFNFNQNLFEKRQTLFINGLDLPNLIDEEDINTTNSNINICIS